MRALFWFRSDLRTADNTGLYAAAKQAGDGLIASFVISPEEWKSHDVAPVKVEFMLRTLRELSASLARLNIPLLILSSPRTADVPGMLLQTARNQNCDALFFNREYEVDESRRDAAVESLFAQNGLSAHAFTDQVIIPPGELRTGEGRYYTVFTPFKKSWIKACHERGVQTLPPPEPRPAMACPSSLIPESITGFTSPIDPALWPAGESHAAARLARFIQKRIARYKTDRDLPALDGTSALSPYLAVGAISPRQCLAAAIAANPSPRGKSPLDSGNEGIQQWITELIWREFYTHILHGFPRVCMGRAFKPATDRLPWSYDQAQFDAWRQGRTGIPIVDAAMRQLARTGWMHNRLRMITAMYLTKDLFIDWRWGERHFMQNLIDGFFASNNGGWQWSASTGTDAAPYFRIFNPISQSRKCDPDGAFIRRYLPELAALDDDAIHDPSTLPPLDRAGPNYPQPIVDHGQARARVLAAFSALK